jgi:hypothetical protein
MVGVMAKQEKSKPGWRERRRERKRLKRDQKIRDPGRKRRPDPAEPGMSDWISAGF